MASNESAQEAPEPIRFRPSAKRKGYRRRIDPDDDVERPSQEPETAPDADRMDEDNEEGEHDQSETAALAALRARSSRKGRLQGVGFRSGGASSSTGDFTSGPLVPVPHDHDDEDAEAPNPLLTIQSRFTHQTGILNDIDHRHMNAYIESRLSSRKTHPGQAANDHDALPDQEQDPAVNAPERPIIQGKIVEVDIRDEQSRASGAGRAPSPKRQRIGPDGKPWRSRNRRGSDDVKRDQLVDDFLHENKLDIYDVPAEAAAVDEGDGVADRRLAEEFRRQYMDDVAKRRQQRKKKTVQAPKPRTENVLRGPKLGGSRNTRAAVRNALLQQNKDGKK